MPVGNNGVAHAAMQYPQEVRLPLFIRNIREGLIIPRSSPIMRETDSDGGTPAWRQLLEAAIVESNLPKFVEAAAAAQRAIASRSEELRNQDSTEAAAERADLERATQTLHDLLRIVAELPNHPPDLHTKD